LRAIGGRVDWDVWVELMEAIEQPLGGPGAYDKLSGAIHVTRTHPFQTVAQLVSSPAALYQLNSRWGIPNQYRHMRSTCEQLPGGRLAVELSIPDNYRGSRAVFRSSLGILRGLPTLIGLPPSEVVSSEITDHRLRAVFEPPRSRTIFSHARRLRERLGGVASMLAQLGEQELELEQKSATLERQLDEQKRVESALRASEERWRALAENAPGIILILSESGSLLSASRAFRGIEPAELVGRDFIDLLEPFERQLVADAIAGVQREFSIVDVRFHIAQESGETWYSCRLGPIGTTSRPAVCAFLTDISEHLRAERELRERQEELQRSQRLEALGRLAGGVAHDFNNLLTVIRGAAELLLSGEPLSSDQRIEVEQIEKASDRAATLTRQLLAFSRQQVIAPEPLSLSEVVENARPMIERLMGEDILLEVHAEASLPHVLLDRSQVDQILMNLAVNARDAMPRGGTLRIEIAQSFLDERAPSAGSLSPGHYVELSVRDTGLGMGPDVRARIFEPFFSTKHRTSGTGLGLAIVKGIAAQSGGDISVESEVGRGTVFRLRFPVCDEPEPSSREPASPRALTTQKLETILVVEDDTPVRLLVAKMLRLQKYRVLETGTPAEALEIANKERVDLLLTDVVMPEISGPELARILVEQHPEIAVLYMSGYAEHEIVHRGIVDPHVALLTKPFSSDALGRRVRECLDQHVSSRRKSS
jgi:PAS domain S-box-containing protein